MVFAIGGVFAAGGLACLIVFLQRWLTGVYAEGVVVGAGIGNDPQTGYPTAVDWHMEVEFTTRDGDTFTRQLVNWDRSGNTYQEGQRLPIYYLVNSPKRAIIDTFGGCWVFPTALLAMGIALLVAAGASS